LFTIQHALDIIESARAVRAILNKEQNQEVLRFEEVHGGARADDNDGSLDEDCSFDSSASFSDHLNSGSSRVFRTPLLRPKQITAIKTIALDPALGGSFSSLIEPAGGSLILYMTAIYVGGITLMIIPLPTITSSNSRPKIWRCVGIPLK